MTYHKKNGAIEARVLRRANALRMRVVGKMTLREIAEELNISPPTVHRDIWMAIEEETKDVDENAAKARKLEDRRLDEYLKRAMNALEEERDIDKSVKLLSFVLKLSERRAKLLGLDEATKQEVTGKDGAPIAGPVIYIPPESDD